MVCTRTVVSITHFRPTVTYVRRRPSESSKPGDMPSSHTDCHQPLQRQDLRPLSLPEHWHLPTSLLKPEKWEPLGREEWNLK